MAACVASGAWRYSRAGSVRMLDGTCAAPWWMHSGRYTDSDAERDDENEREAERGAWQLLAATTELGRTKDRSGRLEQVCVLAHVRARARASVCIRACARVSLCVCATCVRACVRVRRIGLFARGLHVCERVHGVENGLF
jgi:hypothetical protein